MAFKHISFLWSTKGVIMVHMGDTAFLQKTHITRSCGWYGFFACAKNPYHHFQSTGRSCLWFHIRIWYQICKLVRRKNVRDYDMAIFISYTISTSGWYGCDRLIWGMIWELPYNSLYLFLYAVVHYHLSCIKLYIYAVRSIHLPTACVSGQQKLLFWDA